MATTDAIKASGGAYTTLQGWWDDVEADITSDGNAPYIAELYDETYSDNALFGYGATTDDTHYYHIRANSAHFFDGTLEDSNVPLVTARLEIVEQYFRIEGIRLGGTYASPMAVTASGIPNGSAPLTLNARSLVEFCEISNVDTDVNGSGYYYVAGVVIGQPNTTVRNCIIYNITGNNIHASGRIMASGMYLSGSQGNTLYLLNNTIFNVSATALLQNYGRGIYSDTVPTNITALNNAIFNMTGVTGNQPLYSIQNGTGAYVDYNATDQATILTSEDPGHNVVDLVPKDILANVSTSSFDARFKTNSKVDTSIIEAGLDLEAGYGFTNDAVGKTRRTVWGIGAFSFTGTIHSIKSGGDYTTIAGWFDDNEADITSDANAPYIGEVYNETYDNGDVTLGFGATTDATHYYHLRAKSDYWFNGDVNDTNLPLLRAKIFADESYTRIEGFKVGGTTASPLDTYFGMTVLGMINCAGGVIVDSMIIGDIAETSTGSNLWIMGVRIEAGAVTVRNCIIYNISLSTTGSGIIAAGVLTNQSPHVNCKIHNNTICNWTLESDTGGESLYYLFGDTVASGTSWLNNILYNSTASSPVTISAGVVIAPSAYTDYNSSDLEMYSTEEPDHDVDFVTAADELEDLTASSFDPRPKNNNLVGAALDLEATYGFFWDAKGDYRPATWDIGALNYVDSGTEVYTRGNYAVLNTNDDDLETSFSAQDYIDVATDDATRVSQAQIGQFSVFLFKDQGNPTDLSASISWNGQSELAPSTSTIYLQVYNRITPGWETVDSDNTTGANTDFTLEYNIADLTDYVDGSGWIACRVYQ